MAEYIDKDTLVAEIEKIKCKVNDGSSYCNGWQHALRMLEIQLNTFKVKKVDLEKEIDNVWSPHFNLGWDNNSLVSINHKSFESIAKHFFELGLKAQKGEEV